jgi:V/A-type H+-transporting ATPase subunit E
MIDLEQANARIQAICDKIRVETLTPAKREAEEIIEEAKREAERIRERAQAEAERLLHETRKTVEEEKQIFFSSMEQAAKQTIELLKQKIEQSLFNPALEKWVLQQLGNAKDEARLIEVMVKAIEKEGLQANLSIAIARGFTVNEVVAHLSRNVLELLQNNSIELGDIQGGIRVSLQNKHMTIDLSDKIIRELVASFVRKDFRKIFFH